MIGKLCKFKDIVPASCKRIGRARLGRNRWKAIHIAIECWKCFGVFGFFVFECSSRATHRPLNNKTNVNGRAMDYVCRTKAAGQPATTIRLLGRTKSGAHSSSSSGRDESKSDTATNAFSFFNFVLATAWKSRRLSLLSENGVLCSAALRPALFATPPQPSDIDSASNHIEDACDKIEWFVDKKVWLAIAKYVPAESCAILLCDTSDTCSQWVISCQLR